jgi:arginase
VGDAPPVALIGSPFHLGQRGVGMGAGPLRLLGASAVPAALARAGREAELAWLEAADEPEHEIGRVFELNRRLAEMVAAARATGELPAIVAGNCNVCLGAVAGIAAERPGILWLDAHPDFHTPTTTDSGFLDGMGLAAATGGCWQTLTGSIPGFAPVAAGDVAVLGVRDIDAGESERIAAEGVTALHGGGGPGTLDLEALAAALDGLAQRCDGLYLHIDLDVVDPSFGAANQYAAPGGLSPDDVLTVVDAASACGVPVAAVSFTAYDPGHDPDERFAATAVDLIAASLGRLA